MKRMARERIDGFPISGDSKSRRAAAGRRPRMRVPGALVRAGGVICFVLVFASASTAWGSKNIAAGQDEDSIFAPQSHPEKPGEVQNEDKLAELKPLEDMIESAKYQEAIPGLKRYLQEHSASARAHYDLGYVYFRTHEIEGAVRQLSKSLQINVNNAQAHKILGLVCTFVGRYDLAEVELRAAAQLEPGSAEIHYFLGRIYYTRQVYPLALKEFKTAIQLDPRYMKAYGNLGLTMEILGKNDEAVEDYKTAEKMNEDQQLHSPWPYEYLSAYYNRQGQPNLAIESAQKALAMDPRCDLADFDLAKAYQIEHNWQLSTDEVEKAIAINSSTPEYFYLLSIGMRRLGKIPESEAAMKRFEEIHNNQNAMALLWRNASHQKDFPSASPPPTNETH